MKWWPISEPVCVSVYNYINARRVLKQDFVQIYVQNTTITLGSFQCRIMVLIRLLVLQSCPISQQGHTAKGGTSVLYNSLGFCGTEEQHHARPTIGTSKPTARGPPRQRRAGVPHPRRAPRASGNPRMRRRPRPTAREQQSGSRRSASRPFPLETPEGRFA